MCPKCVLVVSGSTSSHEPVLGNVAFSPRRIRRGTTSFSAGSKTRWCARRLRSRAASALSSTPAERQLNSRDTLVRPDTKPVQHTSARSWCCDMRPGRYYACITSLKGARLWQRNRSLKQNGTGREVQEKQATRDSISFVCCEQRSAICDIYIYTYICIYNT